MLLFCCSGTIPRLSLIRHSLNVGVFEKPPSPLLTGEQYGKVEPKYPEGGHYQSVLHPQWVFNIPILFLIIQWRWQCHLTWSLTHDVVSREINLWKSFDLLLGLNLWPLTPSAWCLTARPPELTECYCIHKCLL